MPPLISPPLKPLLWVGGSRKAMSGMPEDVKDVFGSALLDLQYGDTPFGAKPFGEGLPSRIWKVVEDHEGDTYRAVYTAAFPEVVYVLDIFMKKSKSGSATPRAVIERVRQRFKAANQHHDEHYPRIGEHDGPESKARQGGKAH
jgi:phage-related protein